jgi:hypothetical protein
MWFLPGLPIDKGALQSAWSSLARSSIYRCGMTALYPSFLVASLF